MPAGRPGTRGAPAEATEPPDARDPAPRLPRTSGGRRGYLDMKIHLEKNLEEERQILLQQQKISRSRAHKYFVESNRRRKAFEEKRKEQEEREQQIREQILQQRKQKFEEVTEKFQRAHIPLSQRRRAVFQKTVPPLEEALKQIQEPSFKSEVYLPSSHRPTLSWRSIPACRAVSTPDPSLADPLPPARAPLIAHHPQVLPSYPALSPTRPSSSLPGHLSVPSARPQALLPAPFLSKPVKYLPRPPAPGAPNFSSSFPRLPAPVLSGPPDHIPHPPQSSPGTPEPDSQSSDLLSKVDCDKDMKENSNTSLPTNKDAFQLKLKEIQKLLEDQHLSSLQEFCDEVKQITNSETLSSVDSLEVGEQEKIYLTLSKVPSTPVQQNSFPLRSVNLPSTNVNCFDEDKLSTYKTQHLSNWLVHLDEPNTQTVIPSSDILSKLSVPPLHEYCNNKEQSSSARTMERVTNTTGNSVSFTYSPPVLVQENEMVFKTGTMRTTDSSSGAFQREKPLITESPAFKFSKSWTTPDSQKMTIFSDQEEPSSFAQENRLTSIPTSQGAAVTPLPFPSDPQLARPLPKSSKYTKEVHPVQCSENLGESKYIKDEKIKYLNCSNQELPLFSDYGPATYIPHNSDSKDKKQNITEILTSSDVISNCDIVGQQKKMKYNIHERNSVRFLKSILKKESKYEHNCFTALVINQAFKLGNKKAAAIRDSIELAKEREKGAEIPKTVKKLRWFDETGDRENTAERDESLRTRGEAAQQWSQPLSIQTRGDAASNTVHVPASAVVSVERKMLEDEAVSENVSAFGASGANGVPLNCLMTSGHNFVKQTWSTSKKEEVKCPLHSGDSKIKKTSPQRTRAKLIRRTTSAKVQSGLTYANRKGAGIRPQSASKVNTFLQAQGKLIVPHPPPKSLLNHRNDKNVQVSQCQSTMPEHSQNIVTHSGFNPKHVLPTEHKLDQWNQENNLPPSSVHSDLITVTPSLSYCSPECQTLAKLDYSNETPMTAQHDGTFPYTPACSNYEERHHSVALRTAKEPVALRKRQPNTLGQNEKSADSTIIRRKQTTENKQRSLLEKKRQSPGPIGQKYSEQVTNFGQNVQPNSSGPKQTTKEAYDAQEVSESTSEFLMAENLVKASVPEEKILTVITSKQLQKPNLASNDTQHISICALSAEEQRILQSLNRLNERLQCVQESMGKNPPIRNTLQIIPLLNRQPRTSLSPDVGPRLQRKY